MVQPVPELRGVKSAYTNTQLYTQLLGRRQTLQGPFSAPGKVSEVWGVGGGEERRKNQEESAEWGRAEGAEMREGVSEGGLSVGMNSLRLCGARFPRPPPGPFDK